MTQTNHPINSADPTWYAEAQAATARNAAAGLPSGMALGRELKALSDGEHTVRGIAVTRKGDTFTIAGRPVSGGFSAGRELLRALGGE